MVWCISLFSVPLLEPGRRRAALFVLLLTIAFGLAVANDNYEPRAAHGWLWKERGLKSRCYVGYGTGIWTIAR